MARQRYYSRKEVHTADLKEGECAGCFAPATHQHADGYPCCLGCYGSDIRKLAVAKIAYCRKALRAIDMNEPREVTPWFS